MAEVAGLVIGAISMVTLWNTCVQAFDTVASGRNYGYDYEVLRVKLEVERIRLLAWGEAVGLASVQKETTDPSKAIDTRLNRAEMRDTVLRLLGCIQHVFEDTQALQRKYGLKQESLLGGGGSQIHLALPSSETQQVLALVFKRAYSNLQRSANEYQQSTPLRLKTMWAISDKAKFIHFVAEIRGFNDSLVHLFPDMVTKTNNTLREDIDSSEEIRGLQLLQQASSEDHEEISETASERLNHLGATMASLLDDQKTETASEAPLPLVPVKQAQATAQKGANPLPKEGDANTPVQTYKETELEKELDKMEAFCDEKSRGALTCSVFSADWSARWTASVYWQGSDRAWIRSFGDDYKGFVPSVHTAFDLYRKRKYITKSRQSEYESSTDEDYVLLDVEADPRYDNLRPGTVTIEGYGLDCWEYEELHGKSHDKTIIVSTGPLPDLPAKKLLRRIDELQKMTSKSLGWDPQQDADDLAEFAGDGNWYFDGYSRDGFLIFSNFYSLLNRRPIFTEWFTTSSVSLAIHKDPNEIWYFLWQVILGRELARRLERFPDASVSGFTLHILSTLIVSDLWINNVKFVLVDEKEAKKAKKKEDAEAKKKESEPMSQNPSEGSSATVKEGSETAKKTWKFWKKGSSAKKQEVSKFKPTGSGKKDKAKDADIKSWDEAWDPTNKTLQIHSLVHERQVEGLLRFAETMKWPYMNEIRDYAENVYANLHAGTTIPIDLYDWIFGIVLPGKWMAYKIVAALVLCTPSLTKEVGTAKYFDMGLSLPKQAYWRSRTVLGRVLGCLPGVKFLCGWIGPCPPLTDGPYHKYIRIKPRKVAPPKQNNRTIRIGGPGPDEGEESIRIQPDEDIQQWMTEIKDKSRWSIPEPPVRQMTTCTLEGIRVKKQPLDTSLVDNQSDMSAEEIEDEIQYRASLVFKIDNEEPVTYTLYTNPLFVTAPSCIEGPHQVHLRELPKFQRNVWNVENLKEVDSSEFEDNGVMIINATGKGAEAVARAWCSERGKSAIVRANGGACFSCAYHVASGKGLGTNVLIWVSSS
ncbi:hypothetical protein FRC14_007342 [Serendipita sp. 396]|nr:hypothetical protein FRC14_007342 [Serendipita sp. 396]KAG8794076.1 hypothetical protein FRC16_010730 [Serendipita sp. 398]